MRAPDVRRERAAIGRSARRMLTAISALLLVPLLCGGSCTVVVSSCTGTCDPCFEGCFCDDNRPCTHPLSAGAISLEAEPSVLEVRDDGALVRTIGPLVGYGAAATVRGRGFERPDLVRYADALVRSNPALFGAARGWTLAPVAPLSDGHLVVLERPGALATFLFDRAGAVTWIEIQRLERGGG